MGITKSHLTPSRRQLIESMQRISHGRIEGLQVLNGEPVFDPPPKELRLFVFGKESGHSPTPGNGNFSLKKQVLELFAIFDRQQSFLIQELMIDNGLPVRMIMGEAMRI